jgi:hypothetical protein
LAEYGGLKAAPVLWSLALDVRIDIVGLDQPSTEWGSMVDRPPGRPRAPMLHQGIRVENG